MSNRRGVDMDLVERLKNDELRALQLRAAEYKATELDQASQRYNEAENACGCFLRNRCSWRGAKVWVYYTIEDRPDNPGVYCVEAIFDCDYVNIVDDVTSSELDDLERQLFNYDNLNRIFSGR
jgi:hypothetical protein